MAAINLIGGISRRPEGDPQEFDGEIEGRLIEEAVS